MPGAVVVAVSAPVTSGVAEPGAPPEAEVKVGALQVYPLVPPVPLLARVMDTLLPLHINGFALADAVAVVLGNTVTVCVSVEPVQVTPLLRKVGIML